MGEREVFSTSAGERLSCAIYSFGTILVYYMVASFLQLYLTNIGITAITVGVIFIIAKVWDALNDPIFGVMVDKVTFKKGRYKPWLKIASVAIPISTILLFIIPADASPQVKVIWAAAAYVLWDTAYTMCDVPVNALVTAMTENMNERNKIYALAAFFIFLGSMIIAILVPSLYPSIGWGLTAVIVAALAFLTMLPLQFKTKERFAPEQNKELSIGDLLKYLFRNKYLLIFTAATIIGSTTNFTTPLATYFAIHCLGGDGWITPLALATAVPILVVSLFVPVLFKRFDKFKVMIITRAISVALDVVIYISGYQNTVVFFSLLVVKQIFFAVWSVSGVMFVADCIEYGQFRNGQRAEGISFSIKAFTNKMVIALSGALGMMALGAYGFIEGEGAVQSAETLAGLWNLYAIWPAIGSLVAIIILGVFYKLRDKDVKLMTRANNDEISREEAQRGLSRQY